MLVNLTDVFTNEGCVEKIAVSYEADIFESRLGNFEIKEKLPFELKLSHIGQSKVLVEGNAKIVFAFACDRCLRDIDYTFDLSIESEVVSPDYSGDDGDIYENDCMDGYHLDVDKLINNEILLNWPVKILCSDECKGICKSCGKNLNDGACGCDDFVPDPRMAMIKDIFNANKEV